jgi:hypothetical protein
MVCSFYPTKWQFCSAVRQLYISTILLTTLVLAAFGGQSQVLIRGTVYDSAQINVVENVTVSANSGAKTITDSLGRYSITANMKDSLSFTFRNKTTLRYAVKDIGDFQHFDLALHVKVPSKYKTIKAVTVFSKTYRQDSIENREKYAKYFDFQKPRVQTSMVNGAVGADVNELINMFRFKRNKRLKKFRMRLEEQEQEKYITYRFNKKTVQQLTQLSGPSLDSFMVIFRPTYHFTARTALYDFYWYIKMSGEQYKMGARKNVFLREMARYKEEDE